MIEIIIVSIISFFIGIISSLAVWWILYKKITPTISFTNKILKQSSQESTSGFIYRTKFENSGNRDIVDVKIYAKLNIKGLKYVKSKYEVTYLPVSFDGIYPIVKPVKRTKKRPIIRINPNKKGEFTRKVYPDNIQKKANEEMLTLEDLLNLGIDSFIEIIAMGYDDYSGARKVFISNQMRRDDIIVGIFDTDSLNIIPK